MNDYSLAMADTDDYSRVHPAKADWRKSSFSTSNGNCIEVAFLAGGDVGVRDSKSTGSPCLRFRPDRWATFLNDIRHADFKGRSLVL
jgi:hypothetical protein